MRKRSTENRGLPTRWTRKHGAYYYLVPPGQEAAWDGKKWFKLGDTLPDAYKVWAERVERAESLKTVGELLDRYAMQVVPTKAVTSHEAQNIWIRSLRSVFGAMPLDAIRPNMIYKYVEMRSEKQRGEDGRLRGGRTTALREVEVLSHAFTKAVEWGFIDRHPFKSEVRLAGTRPRDRYVEDWELIEVLALPSRRKKGSVLAIQAYLRIKLMTGMARSDLLRLTAANLRDDGVHIQRHKTAESTGKRTIYDWTPELRAAVEAAKAARPARSLFLFCKRDGSGYIDEDTGRCDGWDSMWGHFIDRVLTDTKVTERFTEHDIRAKAGSDAETLEHARALLSHADARTTEAIYRRKPERVKPLGGVG